MAMTCSQIKTMLSDYLADNLSSEKKLKVADHLASCEHCTKLLKEYEDMIRKTGNVTPVSAPPDFLDKVKDRQNKKLLHRNLFQLLFVPLKIKIPVQVATIAVVGMLIFFMLPYEKSQSPMMKTDSAFAPITEPKKSPAPIRKKVLGEIQERAPENEHRETFFGIADESSVKSVGRALEVVLVIEKDSSINKNTPAGSTGHEQNVADTASTRVSPRNQVDDVSQVTDIIIRLLEKNGGKVLKVHRETRSFHRIRVRIPSSQVSLIVDRLASLGSFRSPPPKSQNLKPGLSILEIMLLLKE